MRNKREFKLMSKREGEKTAKVGYWERERKSEERNHTHWKKRLRESKI